MDLHGRHLLGAELSRERPPSFHAHDPRTGERLEPGFAEAAPEEIARAAALAAEAHRSRALRPRAARAELLERVARGLEEAGDALIGRAASETGLPAARLQSERARTVGQLRTFAALAREGALAGARIDHGDPERTPQPKPDLRRLLVPLGPVAVFGAANFPLAFSVAGGDTASAVAAGCPVVVKAHPAHPGTSEIAGGAVRAAVAACGLPAGAFSLVHGALPDVGLALVRQGGIRAVGFTGSLAGGRALFDAAAARDEPIPVYAEMGSTNPLFLLPEAVAQRPDDVARGLHASVTLGVGQFCTNPGLVFVLEGDGAAGLVGRLAELFGAGAGGTMLHAGIAAGYARALERLTAVPGVRVAARGAAGSAADASSGVPALVETDGATFLKEPATRDEVFGPATLVVRCRDRAELLAAASALPGQLAAGVHGTARDLAAFEDLVHVLEEKAGRLLVGGFPTGVDVCPAMTHGGPYPATTAPTTTSVGTAAAERFQRPLTYQDFPQELLPEELRDGNPAGIPRLVDGRPEG